jgi:hypothetical protein
MSYIKEYFLNGSSFNFIYTFNPIATFSASLNGFGICPPETTKRESRVYCTPQANNSE